MVLYKNGIQQIVINRLNPDSFCLFLYFSHEKYSTNVTINDTA